MRYYQELESGFIRSPEGVYIPNDQGNSDYQEAIKLIEKGEAEILPAAPTPEPTRNELRKQAILAKWSVEDQLEAITEKEMGRPEKMTALTAHIAKVRLDYP